MIVESEFQNSNFSGILPEIFWKSGNSQILADLDQFGCTGYHFHSVFITDLNFELRISRFQLFCSFSFRNFPEIWKFSIFMQFQCIGHHLQLIFVTEVDLELYSEFGILILEVQNMGKEAFQNASLQLPLDMVFQNCWLFPKSDVLYLK